MTWVSWYGVWLPVSSCVFTQQHMQKMVSKDTYGSHFYAEKRGKAAVETRHAGCINILIILLQTTLFFYLFIKVYTEVSCFSEKKVDSGSCMKLKISLLGWWFWKVHLFKLKHVELLGRCACAATKQAIFKLLIFIAEMKMPLSTYSKAWQGGRKMNDSSCNTALGNCSGVVLNNPFTFKPGNVITMN